MYVYIKEIKVKIGHQGDHATCLILYIIIKEGTFIHRLFDKRDSIPFLIVRIPNIKSNITENNCYSVIKGKL